MQKSGAPPSTGGFDFTLPPFFHVPQPGIHQANTTFLRPQDGI
jgi:hypothetical protein